MNSIHLDVRRLAGQILALLLVCLAIACKGQLDEPQTGSETNFLRHCNSDCAEGLTCLCGVCTRSCKNSSDCSAIAKGAACVPVPASSDTVQISHCAAAATCELACVLDDDCAELGSAYRCESGYCRKGVSTCTASPLAAGDHVRSLNVDGRTRSYLMHVPTGYAGNASVPLVLDFHPMGAVAEYERETSGFRDLSDLHGFIAVWPQGIDNTWNVGPCCSLTTVVDDYAFVTALVRRLTLEACIDTSRVYAAGFSMGGMMAYYSACRHAELFAGVAVSSMDLFVDSEARCEPARPIREIAFRGTSDTVVPYAGGKSSPPGQETPVNELLGAVGTFQKWATVNGCTDQASLEDGNGCSYYSKCLDGTRVGLCTVQGGAQIIGSASIAWDFISAPSRE